MKHLVFILALLITAPAITCNAQMSNDLAFKQAFSNIQLASESSPGLQPIGALLSRGDEITLGILFSLGGIALSAIGVYELLKPNFGKGNYSLEGGVIALGVGIPLLGIGIYLLTKK